MTTSSEFIPSEYLKMAISGNNHVKVRNELCGFIHKDPAFKKHFFYKALEYLEKQRFSVIQKHDYRPFIERKEDWNQEYWALVVSDLMSNFSKERIDHVKEVGEKVFSEKTRTSTTNTSIGNSSVTRPSQGLNRQPTYNNRSSKNDIKKKFALAAIILGVVIFLIAAMGFKNFLIIVGILAIIAIAAFMILKKKKKRKRRW